MIRKLLLSATSSRYQAPAAVPEYLAPQPTGPESAAHLNGRNTTASVLTGWTNCQGLRLWKTRTDTLLLHLLPDLEGIRLTVGRHGGGHAPER